MLWNVCSKDLFEDLEPDDTNTAWRASPSQVSHPATELDSLSQFSGSMPSYASHRDRSASTGSSMGSGEGHFHWGTPLLWHSTPPPGSAPPPPPPGLGPPQSLKGKLALWDAAGNDESLSNGDSKPMSSMGPTASRSTASCPSSAAASIISRDSSAPPEVAAGPGTPMVLWCEATPSNECQVMEALGSYYGNPRPQAVHFWTPARFTRWLFGQPRGEVDPWALLIVGWREAKPSAMAIAAARSDDTSSLRPDARRPQLLPLTGTPSAEVGVAVEAMIIILEQAQHYERVAAWAKDGGRRLAGCDIHVASDIASLQHVVHSLQVARNRRRQVLRL